jgi:hypothetical protein
MAPSLADITGFLVQIFIEHRESDEKCETDEIFDALDVLVKVHQGMNAIPLTNSFKYLGQHVHLLYAYQFTNQNDLASAPLTAGLLGRPLEQTFDKANQQHDRRHQLHYYNQGAKRQEEPNKEAT